MLPLACLRITCAMTGVASGSTTRRSRAMVVSGSSYSHVADDPLLIDLQCGDPLLVTTKTLTASNIHI